jgi:5'(3')-deoxyribonucleotidase
VKYLILLDLDGVICNFIKGALSIHNQSGYPVKNWSFFKDWGMSSEDFWGKIDKDTTFWESLEPYPWMGELVSLLPNFTLSTSPSFSPYCYYGKRKWVQKYFGYDFSNLMIGAQKELMAQSNRILIDDSEKNCERFISAGGHAILFPQEWNVNRGKDPILYIKERLNGYQISA